MTFTGPKKEKKKKKKQEENKAKNPSTALNYQFLVTTSLFWPQEHWLVILPLLAQEGKQSSAEIRPTWKFPEGTQNCTQEMKKILQFPGSPNSNSDYRLSGGNVTQVQLQLTGTQVCNTEPQCNTLVWSSLDWKLFRAKSLFILTLCKVYRAFVVLNKAFIRLILQIHTFFKNSCQGRFSFYYFLNLTKQHYLDHFFPSYENKSQHPFLHLMKSVGTGSSSDFAYLLFAISY